ncbi:MAG TPA: 6-pyruvoyl-tetrahydropterin synthase-related protein, partial [Pyrinomonadaceae bacterium]|nr:6-pyruvoyl-tetrahydropterin synthase-related protein [Pyrinomonadaceae bacterium]
SFDIILTFPITASLVGFFVFDQAASKKNRNWGLAAFYLFMGVAVLAKGLIGFVFPFAIVAFYHVLMRKMPRPALFVSVVWGTLLAVAVASTWYLPMYLRHGWEFIDQFFVQHHFQRYTSNKYRHPQPFHFFWWVLPLMTIPWIPFFFVSVWRTLRGLYPLPPAKSLDPLTTFAWAWMLVPLVFFSLSGSKLPGYILPALPAAIVIAATSAHRFALRSAGRAAAVKGLAAITLIVIASIITFILPGFADADSVKRLIADADERGFSDRPVVGFLTISHNAEFYAAGRVLRNPDGTQRRLAGNADIPVALAEAGGGPLLLLVRPEQLHHLTNDTALNVEVLSGNGELDIVAVRLR